LLGETGHLAVVDHDRHAVFIDAGLLALLHHLVQLGEAVDLPLLAVEAQVLVLAAGIGVGGLPLETQVGIAVVVGGLDLEVDRAGLAGDGHRFEPAGLDQRGAQVLLGARFVMAGHAGVAALHLPRRALVGAAAQPFVGGLAGVEEGEVGDRDGRPVDRCGVCRHRGLGRE
jgi:hypothetical protein